MLSRRLVCPVDNGISAYLYKIRAHAIGQGERTLASKTRALATWCLSFLLLTAGWTSLAEATPTNDELNALIKKREAFIAQGDYPNAVATALQVLELAKKLFGPESLQVATALNDLAILYQDTDKFEDAEKDYLEALRIDKKLLGDEDLEVATILNNLAGLYDVKGDYDKVEGLYQEALRIRRKTLAPDDTAIADTLCNLGSHFGFVGLYWKVEPYYLQAIEIYKKKLGADAPRVALALQNLGGLYEVLGDYQKGELSYQEALRAARKNYPNDHPLVVTITRDMGLLYDVEGEYAKAEVSLQEALRMAKAVYGEVHSEVATILIDLADLWGIGLNDYERAESFCQQAMQIDTKVLGSDSEAVAEDLASLGKIYYNTGQYQKGERLLNDAIQIEAKKSGADNINLAYMKNILGLLSWKSGDNDRAEQSYLQALPVLKKALGDEHPDVATLLFNLARLYHQSGQYAKAQPPLEEAVRIKEKAGVDDPFKLKFLNDLAYLNLDVDRPDQARAIATKAGDLQAGLLAKVLSFTAEKQRLAYQKNTDFFSVLAATHRNSLELATAVLRYKQVVLDSIMEDRAFYEAGKTAEERDLIDQLSSDKQQIGQLLLQDSKAAGEEVTKRVNALEEDIQGIESKLAANVAAAGQTRRSLAVTTEQITAALPPDTALIEYYRYRRYLSRDESAPAYGAIVLLRDHDPIVLDLVLTKDIEPLITRYLNLLKSESDSNDSILSDVLRKLDQQIWEPVESVLPANIRRVLISPDDQISFLSFATLLDSKQRLLAEKLNVEYVSAGRDLLESTRLVTNTNCVAFANPDFAKTNGAKVGQRRGARFRGSEKRSLTDMRFGELPHTTEEVNKLRDIFNDWGWTCSIFGAQEATKAALLQVRHPFILHLATHGFFAGSDPNQSDQSEVLVSGSGFGSKYFANPMHQSGLALVGANATLSAWRSNRDVDLGDDGIFTAEDASTLDLHGTWLVVLSACDTGQGEPSAGEGVMGLRRGFLEAGAQNLLMTLWPIEDKFTAQFMVEFYRAAHDTGNAPSALAAVQRAWLTKLRQEKGLGEAVRLAGPFILTFRGKP
jgi:CHAT domain-containing protein/Flp pilus assembly protein TadD